MLQAVVVLQNLGGIRRIEGCCGRHAKADAQLGLPVRLTDVVMGIEIGQSIAQLLERERIGVAGHVLIDITVIPVSLVIPLIIVIRTCEQRRCGASICFLLGSEIAAVADVGHKAEHALIDDFLVNVHVGL